MSFEEQVNASVRAEVSRLLAPQRGDQEFRARIRRRLVADHHILDRLDGERRR